LATATIADIADAAGIAKGTVYLYFESKTELLAGLRARHVERFTTTLNNALAGSPRSKPMFRLDKFIDEFFGYSVAHRELHHLLFHEAGFSEDDAFAEVKAVLGDFIGKAMSSGAIARGDAEIVTDYLVSGVHGSLVTALHQPAAEIDKYLAAAKQLSRRVLMPSTKIG
jgi:AcrR family transcriptional regulator